MERSLEDLSDASLLALKAYWERLRSGRLLPSRRDLDPVEMPRDLLPNLFIVDILGDAFRYRLAGTEIERLLGRPLAGRDLCELALGTEEDSMFAQYEEAVQTKRPTYCEHEFVDTGHLQLHCRHLLLPLSDDGTVVANLLGACTFIGTGRIAS